MTKVFSTMERRIRVKGAPEHTTPSEAFVSSNPDLNPVEPARRTWTATSYASFWIADGVNLSTAVIVASSVADGLAWWQVWIAVWIGYGITAAVVIMAARPGAVYHIGFPVLTRASFGIFGSIWPIINRVATATLWTAFQSYLGGECITLVIRSIWPSYANIPNGIPASAGVTTQQFVSFFLFWLLMLPAAYIRVEKLKYLFMVKAIVVPTAFIGMMGWAIGMSRGGIGAALRQPGSLQGSTLGWAFVTAVMNQIANFVTLMLNETDFARVARRPSDTVLPQAIAIPMTFGLTSLFGLIITVGFNDYFGKSFFNVLDILSALLDENPHRSSVRAGIFFIAASFTLGQIGTNVAANTLSAGSDMTALLPRYLTIRRGGLISLAIALCICPWHLASSNSNFATYLSAYSVLLAPFIGIILSDYYIVRRGLLNIPDLYTLNHQGNHWYKKGVNFRAYLAYIAGLVINIVGFAGAVGATVSEAATHIYTLAFFTGSLLSALVYVSLCHLYPPPGSTNIRAKAWLEPKGGYEAEDWDNPTAGKVLDPEYAPSLNDSKDASLHEKQSGQAIEVVEY
ncbi:hypothetical protein CBS101457_002937 [Exobasidium rhododendri]|nr:hypothetical protein CBS101457_002937 [Exobasidium rhododendri]